MLTCLDVVLDPRMDLPPRLLHHVQELCSDGVIELDVWEVGPALIVVGDAVVEVARQLVHLHRLDLLNELVRVQSHDTGC